MKEQFDVPTLQSELQTLRLERDRLRESEQLYSNLVELAAIGISHVDPNGRFVHVNRRLCEMLGYSRTELLELSVQQVSHPDDQLATEKERLRLIAGEIDSFKAEKRYLRKDGTPIWVHITVATRRGVDARRLHDVSIIEDITERREAQNRVQFLATHDEMTGLANRTLFNELLSNAIARDRRYGRRFAVLFIDLDRFKIINDSLGHEGGDQLLKEMASRLKANVRESDVLARFGGDEFALVLPDTGGEGAFSVGERILERIAAHKFLSREGLNIRLTASVGVATLPDVAASADELVQAADAAMYKVKDRGKNGIQAASAPADT